jgi:hypothetical protein
LHYLATLVRFGDTLSLVMLARRTALEQHAFDKLAFAIAPYVEQTRPNRLNQGNLPTYDPTMREVRLSRMSGAQSKDSGGDHD